MKRIILTSLMIFLWFLFGQIVFANNQLKEKSFEGRVIRIIEERKRKIIDKDYLYQKLEIEILNGNLKEKKWLLI